MPQKLSRRGFLKALGYSAATAATAAGFAASCAGQKKQPNILFIFSDDHAYQAISAYGGRLKDIAPTPNIDRLANEGIRFDRCYVTNSICAPSRATILTGKHSHLNGVIDNRVEFDGSQLTFPKLLREQGYQTAIVGKWHLKTEPTGFDYWQVLPGQGHYYNPDFRTPEGIIRETGYVTDIITDKALNWLKDGRDKKKPFMLMLQHKAPHREWSPAIRHINIFDDVEFPEPDNLFDDYSGRGTAAHKQDMTLDKTMRLDEDLKMPPEKGDSMLFTRIHNRMNDEQREAWEKAYKKKIEHFRKTRPEGKDLIRWKYKRYMEDYLGCIRAVDENVGRVLDYLKESGLEKNTVVVYSSDQGFYLGEHGWFDKRWMYEESYKTPLLVRWPGVVKPGSVNEDLVSNLDFAQTFLDIGGGPDPEEMQGESLVPLLKGKTPPDWRESLYYHYYEFPGAHSVRRHEGVSTRRYKLLHFYDLGEWEMYDLQTDPLEMKSVYGDPAYTEVQDFLHKELERLRAYYKLPELAPDPNRV